MVDVCITTISVDASRFPWPNTTSAKKWSTLIAHKRFDEIRGVSQLIYDTMDCASCVCPTVSWDGYGLSMKYSYGDAWVRFIVTNKKRPRIQASHDKLEALTDLDTCIDLPTIVKKLGNYLHTQFLLDENKDD